MRSLKTAKLGQLGIIFMICLFPFHQARAQYDMDGNGVVDLILMHAEEDGQLRWFAQDLATLEVRDLGLFGFSGLQSTLAPWGHAKPLVRAYVTHDQFGQFELAIEGVNKQIYIGQSKTTSTVFLGRDYNGSGVADVVLVNGNRERLLSWIITFDPLTGTPSTKRILFGRKNELPFLFKQRGDTESLAVLCFHGRHALIYYRRLDAKRVRKIRLRGFAVPRTRPFAIHSASEGRDTLAFIPAQLQNVLRNEEAVSPLRSNSPGTYKYPFEKRESSDNLGWNWLTTVNDERITLTIVDGRGKKKYSVVVPDGFFPFVVDFNSDGTEELSFISTTRVLLPDEREIPLAVNNAFPLNNGSILEYPAQSS